MTTKTSPSQLCSQPALSASTGTSFTMRLQGLELPSVANGSLGPQPSRPKNSSMRLTTRDIAIIELVASHRALRADQIHLALFSRGAASRAQRRLTLLVRNHYLDRLPRRTPSD